MSGFALCVMALASALCCARRSLAHGLVALYAWGYAYGIIRANLASTTSYFIFDAAVMGLYLNEFVIRQMEPRRGPTPILQTWVTTLMILPILLVFLPFQPLVISLVGLRANIFFLPAMLLGMRLKDQDLSRLSAGIACLNIIVLGIALAEYVFGIERFYPRNGVTELIYAMGDVAGFTAYRIPGTFGQAHTYAGTMCGTMPLLYGGLVLRGNTPWRYRILLLAGIIAALLGVLLAASRSSFIYTALACTFIGLNSSGVSRKFRCMWLLVLAAIAMVTMSNERLQRFTTLKDTDYIQERVAGSVNHTFWEILLEYPIGNGLGGGGSSIPYFWQNMIRQPVGLENEYCRIMLEQTIIGLLLWVSFFLWCITSSKAFVPTRWKEGRKLAWFLAGESFLNGMLGIGMFTAIPGTFMLFQMIGWFSTPPATATPHVFSDPSRAYPIRRPTALSVSRAECS